EGEERFDESLGGAKITVTGIVRELRKDEAFCLKMEEDNINSHENGTKEKEAFDDVNIYIKALRDSISSSEKGYISSFSLEYVSHVANN
ncbi:hypothetical protein ACFLRR_03695, partial [Bacteroidota bacterium]